MILKKKLTVGGAFAKKSPYSFEGKDYDADIKDGDIITILDSGNEVEGNFGSQHVFSIKTRNGDKNLAFNQTSLNNLIDGISEDTEDWVGKQVKVFIVKAMVSGKLQNVAYIAPEDWSMNDYGEFFPDNF